MEYNLNHVFNRGVDKRKIFLDRHDYIRFISSLVLLNNKKGKIRIEIEKVFENLPAVAAKQDKLVEILQCSLLPNHYHLLLHEVVEGGVSEFTRRLGNSYTKYFNSKYEGRSGYLFQNKVQIVPITENAQMLYIPFYIDLNCVDIKFKNWKEDKKRDTGSILEYLRAYQCSSYSSYCGQNPVFDFLNKDLFYRIFDTNHDQYEKQLMKLIREPFAIDVELLSTWHVDKMAEFKRKK